MQQMYDNLSKGTKVVFWCYLLALAVIGYMVGVKRFQGWLGTKQNGQ